MLPRGTLTTRSMNPRLSGNHLVIVLSLTCLFLITHATSAWDPYEVLGVNRGASLDQIKKAYRELAKRLHPDKSGQESGKKFIEVNKAFNILKDPARRSQYDQSGETSDRSHRNPSRNADQRWHFRQGSQTFTFYSAFESNFHKKSITARQYHDEYVKESRQRPFFIFFYVEFCPACNFIEATWSKITDELSKYNVGAFTINVHKESRLAQELGVSVYPHIACLVDGQIHHYYQAELSLPNIVKFLKSHLPTNLIPMLTAESDQDRFLTLGPQLNRLSAIVFHHEPNLKLRFLLLSFEMRQYYRFGQISTKSSDYTSFSRRYNLAGDQAHVLVFDEDIEEPSIRTSLDPDTLDISHLRRKLMQWPFLQLPRLNSRRIFDDLCFYTIPRDGDKARPHPCVILFTSSTNSPARKKLREFIKTNNLGHDEKMAFAVIDPKKQSEFVRHIIQETNGTRPFRADEPIDLRVLILERHPLDARKAVHRWLTNRWNPDQVDELDRAKIELHEIIAKHKLDVSVIRHKLTLIPLNDEDGLSLIERILQRIVQSTWRGISYLMSRDLSTFITLVSCALCASLFIYQPRSETLPRTRSSSWPVSGGVDSQKYPKTAESQLKLIELKAETYNGLVRLLKPGYRSIILLLDNETKEVLLPEFRKAVWPYRCNKSLSFGYLLLEKNLHWYESLLERVLGTEPVKLNPKKCIGTVLSLNGFKRYFRVYHAKYKENIGHLSSHNDDDDDGSFLGFGGDEESNDYDWISEDDDAHLLAGLPIWLDKMFDGLTKRHFVDFWPDTMQ